MLSCSLAFAQSFTATVRGTVKDPSGAVLRVEEKEMVLQQYTAREPVGLTTTKPPAVLRTQIVNGKIVEVAQ